MNQQDWHPADVIAALKKRGMSLAAVSPKAGLASSTLANTLPEGADASRWSAKCSLR